MYQEKLRKRTVIMSRLIPCFLVLIPYEQYRRQEVYFEKDNGKGRGTLSQLPVHIASNKNHILPHFFFRF